MRKKKNRPNGKRLSLCFEICSMKKLNTIVYNSKYQQIIYVVTMCHKYLWIMTSKFIKGQYVFKINYKTIRT